MLSLVLPRPPVHSKHRSNPIELDGENALTAYIRSNNAFSDQFSRCYILAHEGDFVLLFCASQRFLLQHWLLGVRVAPFFVGHDVNKNYSTEKVITCSLIFEQ